MKTTYSLSREWDNGEVWEGWKKIWKAKILQRVKIFV